MYTVSADQLSWFGCALYEARVHDLSIGTIDWYIHHHFTGDGRAEPIHARALCRDCLSPNDLLKLVSFPCCSARNAGAHHAAYTRIAGTGSPGIMSAKITYLQV